MNIKKITKNFNFYPPKKFFLKMLKPVVFLFILISPIFASGFKQASNAIVISGQVSDANGVIPGV